MMCLDSGSTCILHPVLVGILAVPKSLVYWLMSTEDTSQLPARNGTQDDETHEGFHGSHQRVALLS